MSSKAGTLKGCQLHSFDGETHPGKSALHSGAGGGDPDDFQSAGEIETAVIRFAP